jgi:S-adenosylmethionine hydrolase
MAPGAARPVIALLTDFGTRDHYAGTMKGVILDLCRDAALVDITHDIPPHDVLAGGLELAAAYRYFPAGTIFVAVVDPGVGSARRGIAAEAGGFRFVAPDNGVLTPLFEEAPPKRVVELTERRYARPTVSRTFEGRDRFAPAAAWLGKGIELTALGRSLTSWHRLDVPKAQAGSTSIEGEVIRVDRFGNLGTNIDRRAFDRVADGGTIEISVGGVVIPRVVSTYADAEGQHPFALFGSTEQLEIAVNGASAAERLALGRGARVSIRRLA